METYASLRLYGPTHPDSVTESLGVAPTSMRVAGRPGLWRNGAWRGEEGLPARHNSWILCTKEVLESRDAERHILHILGLLSGKEACLGRLVAAGWRADIFVFWVSKSGHGGPQLTPGTMEMLAGLGLTVGFDIYFNDQEEES